MPTKRRPQLNRFVSQNLLAILAFGFSACATPKAYVQEGEKNFKVMISSDAIMTNDSVVIQVAEFLPECTGHFYGQVEVSASKRPTELALIPGKQYTLGLMYLSKGLPLISNSLSVNQKKVQFSVKDKAQYELIYTKEDNAMGVEIFEVIDGKRTSLPLKAQDDCGQRKFTS